MELLQVEIKCADDSSFLLESEVGTMEAAAHRVFV